MGYYALGTIRIFIGHFAEAVDSLLHSLRLSPNDAFADAGHGTLLLLAG